MVALTALGGVAPSIAQVPELPTLRVASAPDDDVTPLLYAQRAGLFTKAGLTVVIERMNNGSAVSAAVAGEAVDIGKSSTMPLINAHARGLPFALIAPANVWDSAAPVSALLVLRGSPIRSARDLTGKTISSSGLSDVMAVSTRLWLERNGGDVGAVRFIELPASSVVTALDDGRVDAAVVSNPNLARALASGHVRILAKPEDAIAKRFLVGAWFANTDYVTRNRAVVDRFVTVLYQAQAYTRTHHAETVEMVAAFTGIEPGTISGMTRATAGGLLDPRDLKPVIDAAVHAKLIDRAFDPAEMISVAALRAPPH